MKINNLRRIAAMFAVVLVTISTMVSCRPIEAKIKPAAAGEIQGPITILAHGSIELRIAAIRDAKTYKWYKDGVEVQNRFDRRLFVYAAGTYKVVGVNMYGEGPASPEHVVTLVIGNATPAFAGTILGPNKIAEGSTIELSIAEIALAETYKWYKDNVEVQNDASRTLTVTKPGTYKVAGVNINGEGGPSRGHVVVYK